MFDRFSSAANRFALAGAFVAVTALGAQAQNPTVGGAEMFPERTIVENASNSADHTTLVAAVKAAGLVDTLSGPGPFTVFAPTDEAFAALPEGTVESLLMPENKDRLAQILTCHVLPAEATSATLKQQVMEKGGSVVMNTVGGCAFTVRMDGDMLVIEDGQGNTANITQADVDQSNGVIHVIDTVLLPAS
jgi:uncharacterized surface protein with fasciclin (FAS1) repeats